MYVYLCVFLRPARRDSGFYSLSSSIRCINKESVPHTAMRATNYWVFYNYVRAERHFNCNESITYTTHSTLPYLDNLEYIIGNTLIPIQYCVDRFQDNGYCCKILSQPAQAKL